MMRKPRSRIGLAGLLFSSLAFLFPGKAKAETLEFPVEFRDPVSNVLYSKIKDATFRAETSRQGNTLCLTVSGTNCEIFPESLNVRLALPSSIESNAEVTAIRQRARVRNYGFLVDEEEEQKLSEHAVFVKVNEKLERLARFGLEKIIGRIPLGGDVYDLIKEAVEKREKLSEDELRKRLKGFELLQIPLFYPGYFDMHRNNLSRTFKIDVSENPELAYIVVSAQVKSKGQTSNIRNIVLGFGETSLKPETEARIRKGNPPNLARPNVPSNIEAFLLEDPELRFAKYIGPQELGQMLRFEIKDSHILTYLYTQDSFDLKTELVVHSRQDYHRPDIGDIALHKGIIGGRSGLECVPGGPVNQDYVVWLVFSFFKEGYPHDEPLKHELRFINQTRYLSQIPQKTRSEFKRKISSIIDYFKARGDFKEDTGMKSLQNLDIPFNLKK
jgi:hypothetical protein